MTGLQRDCQIRNNNLSPHPMIFQKNITNSQVLRPKTTLLRPVSQQRATSPHHFSPSPHRIFQNSPNYREMAPVTPQNEYYVQGNPNAKDRVRPVMGSAKIIPAVQPYSTEMDNIRTTLMGVLQRTAGKLGEEIARQAQLIRKLQKKIQHQAEELQAKNTVIQTLNNKLQRSSGGNCENKRIEDLEARLRVLVGQMEDERILVHEKLEKMAERFVRYFGTVFHQSRQILSTFVLKKSMFIQDLTKGVDIIADQLFSKILTLQTQLQTLQISLKQHQQQAPTQTCSQINLSKQTASHNSSTSSSKPKSEDLFLSDYFFHPSETDNPSFKMIQDLARQREKLQQLPIRVYLDTFGRLKYFQSRTFIFDRKGNFCTPNRKDLILLQQKGWIKAVQE